MSAAAASPRRGIASWRQTAPGEYLAEFFGTFILILFGDGVVAMAVAALNQSGRGAEFSRGSGDWLLTAGGGGFAVPSAVSAGGGVPGAHITPAVTVAFAARRDFPWRKVPG